MADAAPVWRGRAVSQGHVAAVLITPDGRELNVYQALPELNALQERVTALEQQVVDYSYQASLASNLPELTARITALETALRESDEAVEVLLMACTYREGSSAHRQAEESREKAKAVLGEQPR